MNIAIILSAGIGSRMKNDLPKQFIEVDNKPIFIYTLENFINLVDKIVLVINKEFKDLYDFYINKFSIKNITIVNGGLTRQMSVYNALSSLNCQDNDIIIIHDGARPLINENIIKQNIKTCKLTNNAVTTVIKLVDTIITKDYNLLDRDNLYAVQTPQTFPYKLIMSLHEDTKQKQIINFSDDAQLAKIKGFKIEYVIGSRINIKITEPDDLYLFKLLKVGDK